MAIVKTEFTVLNADSTYQIPGDWSAAQIVANYSTQVPGIANMVAEETVETRAEGEVKVITFKPRTGTKG
jgi:hypothetical protein